MSSLARHSDPSVTLPSRMGAFTRGIAVGSPHNSNRLHSSVWEKSPPFRREVQDADDEDHHVSGPGGRLVCHHRPEGCVFSHPGCSKTQEIPSVRLWREGLSIQGPALRPGFGPEDIYQMHGCCTGPFEAPGHPCTELSG